MSNPKLFITKVFSLMRSIARGTKNLLILPFNKKFYSAESYFPEMVSKRKSKFRIIIDQCIYILNYSVPNTYYFLYGFDIKRFRNQKDYIDAFYVFSIARDRLNKTEGSPYIVLRDKSLFGIVAEAYGINTPKNLGIIQNGCFYSYLEKNTISLSQFPNVCQTVGNNGTNHFFFKRIDGECANGVFSIWIKDGSAYYKEKPIDLNSFFEGDKRYLVQLAISNQHPQISALHPYAINTIRLCTVYNKQTDEVDIFSCVLRVGTGDRNVDNWAAGGLSIGVDTDKGTLREYGFYKPGFGTKVKEHPDSHIVFKDYKVPYLKEALEQAKEFHRRLYGIHSIGWDIAITESGPCFIEGNDNWEIGLMQISNHGLRKEFSKLFN